MRQVIRSGATEFIQDLCLQRLPKIGPWQDKLYALLAENARRPRRERVTHVRVFEELRTLSYPKRAAGRRICHMAFTHDQDGFGRAFTAGRRSAVQNV